MNDTQSRHRLREARSRAGLSAEQVEASMPWLFKLESAEVLTDAQLAHMAKRYRVSQCWLRGHNGQEIGQGLQDMLDNEDVTGNDRAAVVSFALSLASCPQCLEEASR